ncbi:MAG: hypothetical protein JNL83_01915, partial [Myxococcales bacterium]|nr:hypothetical protein [Myxococcales bacterium]
RTMAEAGRAGDRDRARLLAQLAVAERKGDHELAARIKEEFAELARRQEKASESQGKQVD